MVVGLRGIVDKKLRRSIISSDVSRRIAGAIQLSKESPELIDSYNDRHYSRTSISLRWNVDGRSRSFQETFFIVDYCRPDIVLRNDIDLEGRALASGPYLMRLEPNFPSTFAHFSVELLRPNAYLTAESTTKQFEVETEIERRRREIQETEVAKTNSRKGQEKAKGSVAG